MSDNIKEYVLIEPVSAAVLSTLTVNKLANLTGGDIYDYIPTPSDDSEYDGEIHVNAEDTMYDDQTLHVWLTDYIVVFPDGDWDIYSEDEFLGSFEAVVDE